MRYATYYPEEGKLCLMTRRKSEKTAKCLDLMEEVWDQLSVLMIAKGRWFAGRPVAVLIKRGEKAPVEVGHRPKAALHMPDQQFLLNFPKGLHAAMKSAAKRLKVDLIAKVFDSCAKTAEKEIVVSLCDGFDWNDNGDGLLTRKTIKELLPYFKSVNRTQE